MVESTSRALVLLLLGLCGVAGANMGMCGAGKVLAVQGNYTYVYNDHRSTATWLSSVGEPSTAAGNLTVHEKPLVMIPNFKLCEVEEGSALTALDQKLSLLYILGEQPTNPNSTTAGPLQLAVVDLAAMAVTAVYMDLPVINTWKAMPLDDEDSHQVSLAIWGHKPVLVGPTASGAGWTSKNTTAFVLDLSQGKVEIEAAHRLPTQATELVEGPSQLDEEHGVFHILVDRVYAGQRIYHVDLKAGGVSFTDVPQYYWMNFVLAEGALYGAAKVNEESQVATVSETSWRWAKFDLASQQFSNQTLGGLSCIPIMNPEDNSQVLAGRTGSGSDGLVYVGITCQPDPSSIDGELAVIDYRAGKVERLYAGLGGLYGGQTIQGLECL